MSDKVIHAIYDDDDVLLKAVKEVREANHHIDEVYTPFPVHGLEKAMGLANTRIAITAFLYGITGLGFAVWMMNYMMIVPIMFELTVFFAAHLMVITFYMRSKIGPWVKASNPDPRTTDNMFLMEVPVTGDEKELETFLTKTGAVETKIVDKH